MTKLSETSARILKHIAQSKRGFTVADILALQQDFAIVSAEELAHAFEEAQPHTSNTSDTNDPNAAACAAIHRARRKLLWSTEQMLAAIIERLEAETGASFADLPSRARGSAPQFVQAVADIASPEQVADTALLIARERSLAYDSA